MALDHLALGAREHQPATRRVDGFELAAVARLGAQLLTACGLERLAQPLDVALEVSQGSDGGAGRE